MPAVNLTAYLKHKDKYGVEIGEWATQVGPGVAACAVCVLDVQLSLRRGEKS